MTTTDQDRETYGTTVTATYKGTATDKSDGQAWEHHAWDVTLTREGESITFPYRMGMGHMTTKCGKRPALHVRYRSTPESVCGHVACARRGWVPTPPALYDVLCSLKADTVDGRSFSEWCGDFGMDTDSRSAMDLYLRCQESEDRSRRFFGEDWERIVNDENYV